jgi:hypothetical protein
MAKYFLPCKCGQKVIVEPRQAGESLVCVCGASLSAPTVLQMAKLEPADDVDKKSQTTQTWGSRDRMLLLGSLALLVGLGFGIWLAFHQPVTRYNYLGPDRIRQTVAGMSLSKSWDAWTDLKRGINPTPDRVYESWVRDFYMQLGAAGILAVGGAVLLVTGWSKKVSLPKGR